MAEILLNPGPVKLHPDVRKALQRPDICHREPEFFELLSRIKDNLLNVYGVSEHKCTIITGSGTAALEAALSGLDNVLVVSNGHYGDRLRNICQMYDIALHFEREDWRKPLDPDKIGKYADRCRPDILAVVHHETSSGMLNPVNQIAEVVHDKGTRLFVDAVASFGGEKLDLGLIDIVASSANKCLEGVPGIAFVLSRHDVQFNPRSFYLDLTKYDQSVPFTPAVHTHYALNAALEVYEREGGITARMERYGRLSTQIRKGLKALGLELCLKEEYYSRILTSAYLPEELNYDTLHDELKKQGYVIYTGKGSLGDRGFRLANMGQITTEDINGLLDAIGELV